MSVKPTLWNKDCFSKVVGEKASLVSIGKSTLLWKNLEYARLQVRLLKNQNARLAKGTRINNQIFSILIEEEIPCDSRGLCKCNYDGFGSSYNVSSSETYVEETACSVNSYEEEVRKWDREVRWSRGEVIGGEAVGEGDQKVNTTKCLVFEEAKSKGLEYQRKGDKGFIYEERVVQKVSEEAVFLNISNHRSASLCNSPYQQDDLAKLVVDVEVSNTQCEPITTLGQEGKLTTHYGNRQNHLLAQEEEGIGEPLRVECGSRRGEEKIRVGSGNQLEAMEARELEQSHVTERLLGRLGDEVTVGGSERRSPPCRRRRKGLWEVGEPSTHPRRLVRIRARSSQVRNSSSSKAGTLTTTISDGDINNCNSRFRDPEIMEEPTKLWELGKHMGIACRGVEEEVVQEFECMEVRDVEFMQRFEEGTKKGYLC